VSESAQRFAPQKPVARVEHGALGLAKACRRLDPRCRLGVTARDGLRERLPSAARSGLRIASKVAGVGAFSIFDFAATETKILTARSSDSGWRSATNAENRDS
jgi:hypothetical protein